MRTGIALYVAMCLERLTRFKRQPRTARAVGEHERSDGEQGCAPCRGNGGADTPVPAGTPGGGCVAVPRCKHGDRRNGCKPKNRKSDAARRESKHAEDDRTSSSRSKAKADHAYQPRVIAETSSAKGSSGQGRRTM